MIRILPMRIRKNAKQGQKPFKSFFLRAVCILTGGVWLLTAAPVTAGFEDPIEISELTPEESRPYSVSYVWDLSQPHNFMRVLGTGAVEPDPLQYGKNIAPMLQIQTKDNKLIAIFSYPCRRSLGDGVISLDYKNGGIFKDKQKSLMDITQGCHVEQVRTIRRRQPSGKIHIIRHILLSCEAPVEDNDKAPTIFLQQIELDIEAGSADLIPCNTPMRYAQLPARDYRTISPTSLNEKYNGSPIHRDMLRLLYAIAAIDSPVLAATSAHELYAFAWELAGKAPAPDKEWPLNWGDEAENVRAIARELTPTLVYFEKNNCFDCEELADFINSDAFGRIFGESFTEMPHERTQEEPIEFVPLQGE